ncbi:MAG TPA: hypothetical protein VE175_01720 [Woeseiaceae bacterium]|nr:hypothetical protein [Woeseiaceae bacterium]
MVTARRAFTGATAPFLMASIARDEPRPLTDFVPSVPIDLEKAIGRALRKEHARRWQSMADVRVALSEIREEIESGKVSAVHP